MSNEKIRVGIIGLTPGRNWAARTHIPALRALPEYEVIAVANSNEASSRLAAPGVRHPEGVRECWGIGG